MKKQLMTLPENKTRMGSVPGKARFLLNPVARFITVAIAVLMSSTHFAQADDYFNPAALNNINDENVADFVNLEQFSQSGTQLPGDYYVTVVVNNQNMGSATVRFIQNEKTQALVPVVTKAMLKEWGVKTDVLPAFKELSDDEEISDMDTRIPQSQAHFVFEQQRLNLSIPQAAMSQEARGFTDESQWDQGLPAFLLNYTVNGAKTWYSRSNKSQENQFVSLQSGVNLGAWRVRNFSTYSRNGGESNWSNVKNYVERNIQSLHSRLTLGDTATSGDVFESVPFRGVRMSSDDAMLPAGQRGFAPVVRGIAQSSAQVTIRQNGYVIYQTYVAPGPFEIADLYPSSYSGNLDVTIEEEDGRERTFVVPFSSLAMMQREGSLKYSLNLGEYRTGTENTKEPLFFEGSAAYGMPLNTTLYGGTIYSSDYQAYSLGAGLNLGRFGALSADVIHAATTQTARDKKEKGQSYRFQYSKSMMQTGTTLALAGYRYSTQGYYDFAEANENNGSSARYNKRTRIQADVSQSLGDAAGSLYLSAYQQNFWGQDGEERTVNTGYSNSFRRVNYSVAYTYTDTPATDKADHQFAVNISIPLGGSNNYSLISSMTTSRDGGTTTMAGFSGSALENGALSYSVQQGYDFRQHNNSGNAGASYRGEKGFMNAGYNYGDNSQRVNYGVQGGVVVHPYGVTLSQPLGETIALVRAPGAAGVAVQNKNGVKTNSRGYAVIPSVTAYTKNDIALNINGMDENVELLNNSTTVVPTRGAVVLADMQTRIGSRLLLRLTRQGNALPFGAIASDAGSDNSGIVDENGVVYLSGMPDSGKVNVKWGARPDEQCTADYVLPADQAAQVVKQVSAQCR